MCACVCACVYLSEREFLFQFHCLGNVLNKISLKKRKKKKKCDLAYFYIGMTFSAYHHLSLW